MPLALARRRLIRPARGPFAFPGTRPGFDPGHMAAQSVRFSGVAFNGNIVDLLTGKPGTIGGTPNFVMNGAIGGAMRMNATGDSIQFSGKPAAAFTGYTLACILFVNTNPTGSLFYMSSGTSGSGGASIGTVGGAVSATVNGNTGFTSSLATTVGIPFFVAVSLSQALRQMGAGMSS